MQKRICFLFQIFVLFIISFSIVFASENEGKMLFEKTCDKCHSLSQATNKKKDEDSWLRTVERMGKKFDGLFSAEEGKKIAKYLASLNKVEEKNEKHDKHEEEYESEFKFKKVKVEQFIKPEVCGDCHSEIFAQWKGSMHSKAYYDPIWRAATKLFNKQATTKGQKLEMKACVKCHTPLGFRSYSIFSPDDDYEKLAELPSQGIFCNWCHNIDQVKHLRDSGYEVTPGGGENDPSTMLGPFKDSYSDYHPTKYSELHTKSEFCGLCHNVSHAENGLPIEQTYNEWKNSAYNLGDSEKTVNCQDCHMRQKPGIPSTGKTARPDNPGKASDDGPDRPHIWTHYFVGGNSIVPKVLGSEVHSQMAIERLTNAADLEIMNNGKYEKGAIGNLKVKVTNSGAGHYLPTGLTEVREMWLELKITDNTGKLIYKSGYLEENGEIEENAILYHTQLGNEKGEHVNNVALADRILSDHRIPPKGYVIEKFNFLIPQDAVSPLKVEVFLKYRSASPALIKLLLGDKFPVLPIVDMKSAIGKIEF